MTKLKIELKYFPDMLFVVTQVFPRLFLDATLNVTKSYPSFILSTHVKNMMCPANLTLAIKERLSS